MKAFRLIFLALLFSNLIYSQGFELTFGGGQGNIGALKVKEILNEEAYLVLDVGFQQGASEVTLNYTKVDKSGNIIFSKGFPYNQFFSEESIDFKFMANSFKVAFGVSEVIIIEIDYDGNLLSEITYSISQLGELSGVKFRQDHSVIFTVLDGLEESNNPIGILDDSGILVWQSQSGFEGFLGQHVIEVLPNDDFLLFTMTKTENYLYKFEQDGSLAWVTNELPRYDYNFSIKPFPDFQSFLLFGENSTGNNTLLSRVSQNGEILWSDIDVGEIRFIDNHGVIHGELNTMYMTGISGYPDDQETILLQLNNEGEVLQEHQYTETEIEPGIGAQLLRDKDNGFIIATETNHNGIYYTDLLLYKIDESGKLNWTTHLEKENQYTHRDALFTDDGCYLMLGIQKFFNPIQPSQAYLAKIDKNGNIYTRQVKGQLVFDENLSCDLDEEEQGLHNWLIELEGYQEHTRLTDENGYFSIDCNADEVTLRAFPLNEYWEPCPEEIPIVFENLYDSTTVNLTMQAVEDCPSIELDISASFLRRCFDNTYHVRLRNTGTVLAENVQVTIELDSLFIFKELNGYDHTLTDQVLNVTIGDIEFDKSIDFNFIVEVSCEAELGAMHCVIANAEVKNECTPILLAARFDEQVECQPNIGSYDPNDKRAFTSGNITDKFIDKDSLIEYQIRFQNTGTDTAFNIVIIDTLSADLDLSTFKLGASSHPMSLEFDRPKAIKFKFENILLPDSTTNEPASHGFVKFSIQHNPAKDYGDLVSNRASIYFDFNEPIHTNNLELEIKRPTSREEIPDLKSTYLSVFPQPASAIVNFKFLDELQFQSGKYSLEIYEANGQLVEVISLNTSSVSFNGLNAGIYFYSFLDDSIRKESGKFMIVD